ncbi:tenectin [Leptinotarsa decemlineata]|uniref:tenectin n=1 Tax=Leptinotarsa decemlineata TaxID=7539 RepID=UPI003D30A914
MSAWTRLTEPGPTLLIVVLVLCPLLGNAAPFENDQSTEIEYYPVADATGCYYNFEHYDEGDRIITNEPCLNCTCHNRMLMCYLRVCPFTKAIGQDCKVEKRSDQCCPIITCPEVPVHLVPQTSTPSTALGHLNEYGCSIDNLFYADGAKVPSNPNNPCEVCYCIRNKTACIIQECTLTGKVVEGCRPVYIEGVCCPLRYDCDHPEIETTSRPLLTSTTTTTTTTTTIVPPTSAPSDCIYQNQVYIDGALVKKDVPCEKCYCMRGDIICAVQECGPTPLDKVNCTALPTKEGQCCPDTYDCEMLSEEDLTTLSYYDVPTTQPTIISSHSVIGEEEKSQKPQEDVDQFMTDNEIKLATEETTATITTKITEAVTEIVESITSTIFGTTERPQEEQISEKEYVKPSEETKDGAPQKKTQYPTSSKDTENEEKQLEKETEKPISRKEEQKPEKETENPLEMSENSTLPDESITEKVIDSEHDKVTEESVEEAATEVLPIHEHIQVQNKKPDSAQTSEIFPTESEEHITTENVLNEKEDHSFDDNLAHDDSDAENNEISENDVTTDQSKLPSTVMTGSDDAHTRPIDQKNIPSQEDVTIRVMETTPIISPTGKPDSEQSAEPAEVSKDEISQSTQIPTDRLPSTEEKTSKISSEETASITNAPVVSEIEKSTESPDVSESLTKKPQEEGQNEVTETPVTTDPKKEAVITEQSTDGNSVKQSSDETVVDTLGTTEMPIKSATQEVDVQPNEENQENITKQATSEIGITKAAGDKVTKPISYDMVTEIQSSQDGLGATEESFSTEVTPRKEVELTSEVTETSRITEIPEVEKAKPDISSFDAQTTTKKPEEEIEIVTGISIKDTEKPQSMDHVSETTSFEIDSNEIEKSSELPDVVTEHFQVSQVEKQSKPSDPNEKTTEIPTASERCTEESCVDQDTSEIAYDKKSEDKTSEIVTPNLEEGSGEVKPSEVVESSGEPENETESYDQKTEKQIEESSEKPEAIPTRATETSTAPSDIYQTYKPDVSQVGISGTESERPTENSQDEVTDKSTLSEKDHSGENQTELPEIPVILVTSKTPEISEPTYSEITSQAEQESGITESFESDSEHKTSKKPTEEITTEPPQTTDRIDLQEPEIPNISDQNVDSTVPSIHAGLNEAVPEHSVTEKSQEELKHDITPNLEEGSGQVKPSEDEDGSGESENETEAYDHKTETPKDILSSEKPEAVPTRATETSTTPTDVYQTTAITQHGDNDESEHPEETVFESTQSSTKTSDLDQVTEKYVTSGEVTVEPVEKVVFTHSYNKESEYSSEYPEPSEEHKPTGEPDVKESESAVTEEEHGIPGEGSCLVDGQTYKNNSNVPPFNQCQLSCKCVSSILQCESVQCMAPPSNLEDCMPVFHSPGSCCPTYSCSVPSATSVIESDSHIIETTPDQKVEKHETTSQSVRDQTTIATTSTKYESEEKITESFTEKESEEPTALHDDLDNEIPDEHFEEHHIIPEHCGEEGCSAIESQTTEQTINEKDETETKKYSVTESSPHEKEEKHTQQPFKDFFDGENLPTVTEKKDSSEKEGTEFSLTTESIIETQPEKEFANAEMTSSVANTISTTTKYDIITEIPSVPEKYPMEDITTSKPKEHELTVPELSTVRQSLAESAKDNEISTEKTESNEAHDEHQSEDSKLGQGTTILPITNTDYESLPKDPTVIKKQESDSTKVFGESTESVTDISSVTQPIQEGEIPDQKPQEESSSESESVTSDGSEKGQILGSGTTQSTSDESVFETATQIVESSTELKQPTQNPELSESTSEDQNVKFTSIKPGPFEQVTNIVTPEQKPGTVDETEEVTTSTLADFVTEIENSITSKPLESADHMTDVIEHETEVPEQSVYDEKKSTEISSEKSVPAITEPYPVEKEEIVTKYLEVITDQPEVAKDMSEVRKPVTEETRVQSTPPSVIIPVTTVHHESEERITEAQAIPDREAVTELHHGLEVATDAAEPGTEKNTETKPESETIDLVTETSSGLGVSTETQPEVIEHADAANELQPEHTEHDQLGTEAGPESEDISNDSEPKPVVVITETPSAFTENVDIVTESRPASEEVPTKEEPKLSEVITESQPEITENSETVTETLIASEVPTEAGTKFADLTTETRPEVTEHEEIVTETGIGSDVITETQHDIIEVSTKKLTQKPETVTESQPEITERGEIVTEAFIESDVTRDSEPKPEGAVTETQSEVTEVSMGEKLEHPVVITETQPEISEVSTEAQSKLPELIAETQTEITEVSTREQSKHPEVITEPQAEITEVPTELHPKLPEIITLSQPETTEFSTEKQSKHSEVITELQAEITEVSTEEQPKLPEIVTVSPSETTEVSTEKQPKHPEVITKTQPEIIEVSTEEQPNSPEIITESQQETTEVTTEDQPKLPEIITESTEISTKEQPENSEVITETQLKNTEVSTSEQPEHSQVLEEVQPESTPERPYHPEIITETQTAITEVSSEEQSKNPESITDIQPEITEISTTEQPEHPEIIEEIQPEISSGVQPKQPEIATKIYPEITEVSTKEQPKYPEVITETEPEINETSTEEESVKPEIITEIQPHITEVSKEEQSKLPEMVTQSQPETTEISTEEQPKHPQMITETQPEIIGVSTEEKPKHPEIITETQPSITEIPAKQHPEYPEIIEISSEEEPKSPEMITEIQPEITTIEQSKYPEIISESQPEITNVATEEPKHSEINEISTEKESTYPEIITKAHPESMDSTDEQPENPEVITETQPEITEVSTGKQSKYPEIITETQPNITEDPKYPDVITEIQPEITEISEGEPKHPDIITESQPEITEVATEEPKHPEISTDSQPEVSEISTEQSKYPDVTTKPQTESTSASTDEPKHTEVITETQPEITEVSTEEQPKHPEIITETQPSISEVSTKEQHKQPEIDAETQSEISEVSTQEQPEQPEIITETKPNITEISTEAQTKHPEVITENQSEVTEYVAVVSETLIGSDVSTEVGTKSGEGVTETLPEIPKINLSQDQFVTEIQPGSQEVLTEKELEYHPEITEISIEKQSRPELGDLVTESHPSEVQPESEVSTTVSNPVEVPTGAHEESESVTETRPIEVLTKAHPEIESVATETYPKPETETSDIQPEVVTGVQSVPAEMTTKAELVPEIFETLETDSPKEVTTESFVQVEPLDDKHKQEKDGHVVTTTDETFTTPHPITQSPRNDSELYTSGPKEEYSTKKFIEGELSTSVPLTSSKPETPSSTPKRKPSHEIPGEHEQLPELPDYQSPVEDYDEDDQSPLGPGTCRYGGKVFVSAQQIPRDDPCDFCFCFRSDIICLQQSCPPPIPNCHEEPIRGFCCPRYECPVGMATSLNLTTTTTTTTTTLPPHFLPHAYKGLAVKNGCQIRGQAYRVGDYIKSASGPCMHCTCGADGQMKCDPKQCSPEPMLRQMIAAAASRRRR